MIKGRRNAESELKAFEESQNPSDRHQGWRYFLEKTRLKAGADPLEATQQRQAQLEKRESKLLQDKTTLIIRPPK